MLLAVRFQFTNEIVVLAAQDDDSLGVFGSSWDCDGIDIVSRNLGKFSPWNLAIAKPLLWSWRMINQQGYFDGVQLQFGSNVTDLGVQVQLIVVSSEVKIKII